MDAGSVAHNSIRNQKLRKGGGEMVDDLGKLGIKRLACRYEVGDMVWGKVRSHPWWPGQILHEAFALPCVNKTKREGRLLVAFFGDNSYGWFDPFDLLPFDISYVEKSKQTNDIEFLNAVKDAEDEARRMAALGLLCWCQGTSNFRTTGVNGFVEVDVCGYQPGGVYSVKQIKNARHGFRPTEMLCFLKKLASIPHGSLERSINLIKNEAFVLAYRKAVFEEVDETYAQAYGSQQIHERNSIGILISQRQMPSEAQTTGGTSMALCPSGQKASTAKKPMLEEISLIKSLFQRKGDWVKSQDISQDFQQLQPKVSKVEKISYCLEDLQVVGRTSPPSDAAFRRKVIVTSSDILDEKLRVSKCLEEDLLSEHTLLMNRKKRKKDCKFELGSEYRDNRHKNVKRELGKGGRGTFSSNFKARGKMDGLEVNSRHSQLLGYLSALARNPFQSVQQIIPATMLQFFLEYRSVVYMKVAVTPAGESETIESCPPKSLVCGMAAKSPNSGTAQDLPSALKPPKKRLKADDYRNVGLNGSITGPEQMSVEEPKRLTELKLLSEEKTEAGDRKLEKALRRGAGISLKVPEKLRKYSQKKPDASRKFREHKMIVIQFPSQSALPSVSELKARFARFGQLHSPPCVFWKSSTCQVRFKCKSDAKAAFACAVKNRSLFGNMKVEYYLQAPEASSSALLRLDKQLVDKVPNEAPQVKKHVTTGESTKPRSIAPQHQLLYPSVQPKSCLKKHLDDEATIVHNETPHVKFMLGGQENTSTEQIEPKSIINNHTNGCSSSGETININAKISKKVQPEAMNNCPDATCSSSQSIDISDQMLSLLVRCHEIVADLKNSLGYVPIKL